MKTKIITRYQFIILESKRQQFVKIQEQKRII